MKCHVCGGDMLQITADLPFRIGEHSIVIIKDVPVFQCENCSEHLLADSTMARIDELLARADTAAELEIVRYAA